MSFFGFGQSADIDIVLNDAETRKKAEHKSEDGRKDKYFLFYDGETVSGKVNVTLKYPGKRLEHNGIKIEFVGQIGECVAGRQAGLCSAQLAQGSTEVLRVLMALLRLSAATLSGVLNKCRA